MTHPGFDAPYVDIDEQREHPVPHRYVHGGFEGTATRFSYYFPPAQEYDGRFFQHVTPIPDSENLGTALDGTESKVGFALASGAYFVETNGGGSDFARPEIGGDMTIAAYRANAACADYSRVVANEVYGDDHRPFGYLYGGSGGAFRTMGAAENTSGVWDGFVPYVIGSPLAIPNVFTVRMHAMRILRDVFDVIDDAYSPGGSGDPYPLLDAEQGAALTEVTRMGFPPRSWFGWRTMGGHAFSALYGGLAMIDPSYFEQFWTTEGYLGADPASSVHRDRLQWTATVAEPIRGRAGGVSHGPRGGVDQAFREPAGDGVIVGVRMTAAAPIDAQLADLTVVSGPAAGARLTLAGVTDDVAMIDIPGAGAALEGLQPGDTVTIDNSNVLAAQTYHRHQVPTPDFAVWDQFRDAAGAPIYPQRPMLVGPLMAMGASGTIQSGEFDGTMIVVSCLNDREAFPWQADWYAEKVREHLGSAVDDRFRLWFIEGGLHGDDAEQEHPTRSVSYLGALHVALRSVAAWVERGEQPPASTSYRVEDGQIVVPPAADARRGIQPTATLHVDGRERGDGAPGQAVRVRLEASVPPSGGAIVAVNWDLDCDGAFDAVDDVSPAERVDLDRVVTFARPGTYFVTARVTAQADGDPLSPWARTETLARARIVVG